MKKKSTISQGSTAQKKELNELSSFQSESEKEVVHSKSSSELNALWADLEQRVSVCTACDLHKTRTQTVFGTGNRKADLLIVGEAPGANEDKQGKPFVGRAGQLLTNMLLAIGIKREEIFITNILKSRPPNNRDPNPEEVKQCTPFLIEQINLIQPKVILALGRIAAHFLLKTNTPMGQLRKRLFTYGETETPLIITYHPAYLLRAPREKSKSYEDLLFLKSILDSKPRKE